MNANRRTIAILLLMASLLSVTLACMASTTATPQPIQDSQAQVDLTKMAETTLTAMPARTLESPPTPTPLPFGQSREKPYPRDKVVSVPNWKIQVVAVKRGEEAWNDIKAANSKNEAPPEGMEYLLVKIHAKSAYNDRDAHNISRCDFSITGDKLINYPCSMSGVVTPEPQLDANLFNGEETEGWAGYLVTQGEGNLILVVNESMDFDSDANRYIALDEGASISTPADLASIGSNDTGIDNNAPAPRTEKVITQDWQLSIVDAIRGEEAWIMVKEANPFNEPPHECYEYIVVKVHVRYLGKEEKAVNINREYFISTGGHGLLHETPNVVSPSPRLDTWLFPGGEVEGWVVIEVYKGETRITLIFNPQLDEYYFNHRYISLEPIEPRAVSPCIY